MYSADLTLLLQYLIMLTKDYLHVHREREREANVSSCHMHECTPHSQQDQRVSVPSVEFCASTSESAQGWARYLQEHRWCHLSISCLVVCARVHYMDMYMVKTTSNSLLECLYPPQERERERGQWQARME